MRKFAVAAVAMVLCVGFVMAEEFTAVITKVDGNKVTFHKTKRGEKKGDKGTKGEAETLPLAKDAKIVKGKFNKEEKKIEAGDAIEKGVMNEMFTKEVNARITTSADNKSITQIITFGGGGGKKKKDAE